MYVFTSSPSVLHVLPISSTFLWSPDRYLPRTTNHVFSSRFSLYPSPYANAFLAPNVHPPVPDTVFHTQIKHLVRCFQLHIKIYTYPTPYKSTLTYLLTPWCRVLLEKLTGLQIVKKFPAFHGTRRFISALTSVRHLSILSQPNPVHIPTSHLLEIHPNIIHPSTPRSPQWSLFLRFPHQDPIHTPLLTHTRHMPSPSHSYRL